MHGFAASGEAAGAGCIRSSNVGDRRPHILRPAWRALAICIFMRKQEVDNEGDPVFIESDRTVVRTVLWAIPVVLLAIWLTGLVADVGGPIHLVLLIAGVVLVINMLTDRRFL